MYICLHVKYRLLLADCNETGISRQIFEKLTPSLLTIRPVGVELIHRDGQTNTTKLLDVFGNFAYAPKHVSIRLGCDTVHSCRWI